MVQALEELSVGTGLKVPAAQCMATVVTQRLTVVKVASQAPALALPSSLHPAQVPLPPPRTLDRLKQLAILVSLPCMPA